MSNDEDRTGPPAPPAGGSGPEGADEGLRADLLALALAAARAAGEVLLDGAARDLRWTTKSSPTDVVTEMDQASERLLVDRLLGARPADGLIGEEGGQRPGTSAVRWVVDPLDGTVNYLYGIPLWSVAIAAEIGGVPQVGVVHCPALGETYSAVAGRPAVRADATGEHRLAVTGAARLDAALVATGFGYTVPRRRAQAAVVADLLPRVRDIRRGGAASVDLCWLASGRIDAYFERGLQPWDLAAGSVIARAAGARVEGLAGAPAGEELVVAAGPALFPALHDLLARARADGDEPVPLRD